VPQRRRCLGYQVVKIQQPWATSRRSSPSPIRCPATVFRLRYFDGDHQIFLSFDALAPRTGAAPAHQRQSWHDAWGAQLSYPGDTRFRRSCGGRTTAPSRGSSWAVALHPPRRCVPSRCGSQPPLPPPPAPRSLSALLPAQLLDPLVFPKIARQRSLKTGSCSHAGSVCSYPDQKTRCGAVATRLGRD